MPPRWGLMALLVIASTGSHRFTPVAIVCRPSGTYAPDFLSPQAHDSLFLNQMLGEIGDLFTAYLFHNLLDLLLQHFENVMAAVLAER